MSPTTIAFLVMVVAAFATFMVVLASTAFYLWLTDRSEKAKPAEGPAGAGSA